MCDGDALGFGVSVKSVSGGLVGGIAVAKDAIVLQDQLHFLRTQLQREQESTRCSARVIVSFSTAVIEQLLQVVVQAVEIGALFRR